MKTFTEYLEEEEAPHQHLEKAQQALLAGDYESAKQHLKQHVQGKSRRADALAAKLALSLRNK